MPLLFFLPLLLPPAIPATASASAFTSSSSASDPIRSGPPDAGEALARLAHFLIDVNNRISHAPSPSPYLLSTLSCLSSSPFHLLSSQASEAASR